MVTVLSGWELVTCVSEHLVRMGQEHTCEARTPLAFWCQWEEPDSVGLAYPREVRTPLEVVKVQAPGLTCTIRPSRDPSFFALATFSQEISPDIEAECRALASQLPALEPPQPGSYATRAEWLEALAADFPIRFAWRKAHPDDWEDAYHRACDRRRELEQVRRQPCKRYTVDVGREGRTQRLQPKFLRTLRNVETRRINPKRPLPLEEALASAERNIVRLQAQGKFEDAAKLEASRQSLVARMASWRPEVQQRRQARKPWGRNALWIDPDQTPRDDVRFVLVVYLLQEQMGECTPEMARFLQRYMGQFRHAASWEERELLQGEHTRFLLEGGGEGLAAILRTYAHPEHWKGHRQFIARTLDGRWRTAARKEGEQSGQGLAVSPRSDGLYSVHDVVGILAREASEDQWRPSPDWLHDRMKDRRLPFVFDARGWKCLDEPGLQCARKLVKDENDRRALVNYQMHALGKSRRAANKYIDEHAAKGESYADITKKLLPRRGREEA